MQQLNKGSFSFFLVKVLPFMMTGVSFGEMPFFLVGGGLASVKL